MPYFVQAVAEMDFGPRVLHAKSSGNFFFHARDNLPCVFFANDGTGLRDLIAKLLRAECLPYIRCLHIPTGRAFAIECYAESQTAYSFTEVELPMRDANWLRKVAELARKAYRLGAKCKS